MSTPWKIKPNQVIIVSTPSAKLEGNSFTNEGSIQVTDKLGDIYIGSLPEKWNPHLGFLWKSNPLKLLLEVNL